MGLRRKLRPMPSTGSNSLVMVASRVEADSAPLPCISQAAVSVNDAPAPSNCWYVVFSSTVTVWPAEPPEPNDTGACCWRPRVTLRPWLSLVVVSQTLTVPASALAWCGSRRPVPNPAAATASATTVTMPAIRPTGMGVGGMLGSQARPPGALKEPQADLRLDLRFELRPLRWPGACFGGRRSLAAGTGGRG